MKSNRLESLHRRIAHAMGEAIRDWDLIQDGDRILVGISGGKDSFTLLHFLRYFQGRAPIRFELLAVHLDQGHPEFPVERIQEYLAREGYEHRIIKKDTYTLVKERIPEGETPCPLCSRYRRGILYNQAVELECNKIALGHHREDTIVTLLMNLLYSGQLKGIPALLRSDDGRNTVIRPMIYVSEGDIREYTDLAGFPVIPCGFCGNTERDRIARLLERLSTLNPKIRGNILASMKNVAPSHLLDLGLLEAIGNSSSLGQAAGRSEEPFLRRTGGGSAASGKESPPHPSSGP